MTAIRVTRRDGSETLLEVNPAQPLGLMFAPAVGWVADEKRPEPTAGHTVSFFEVASIEFVDLPVPIPPVGDGSRRLHWDDRHGRRGFEVVDQAGNVIQRTEIRAGRDEDGGVIYESVDVPLVEPEPDPPKRQYRRRAAA